MSFDGFPRDTKVIIVSGISILLFGIAMLILIMSWRLRRHIRRHTQNHMQRHTQRHTHVIIVPNPSIEYVIASTSTNSREKVTRSG